MTRKERRQFRTMGWGHTTHPRTRRGDAMGLPAFAGLPHLLPKRHQRYARNSAGMWEPVADDADKTVNGDTGKLVQTQTLPVVKPKVPVVKDKETVAIVPKKKDEEPIQGPRQRQFKVFRTPKKPSEDIGGVDDYPWHVEEVTYGDSGDDYGRMRTHADAMMLVEYMMRGSRFAFHDEGVAA